MTERRYKMPNGFPGLTGPSTFTGFQPIDQVANLSAPARALPVAGSAAAGGGLFAALAAPGVGTALTLGATLLTSLFSGGQKKKQLEMQRFQAELAAREQSKARTAQQSAAASRQVQQSIGQAAQSEAMGQQALGGSLQRFFL